ncbi:hypothetical protein [Chamaesiphon sp.]
MVNGEWWSVYFLGGEGVAETLSTWMLKYSLSRSGLPNGDIRI